MSYGLERPLPENNVLYPFLAKHASLEYEKELRAIILWGEPEGPMGLSVAVDLPTLVERVHIAPASPEWMLEVVRGIVGAYRLNLDVRRSEID